MKLYMELTIYGADACNIYHHIYIYIYIYIHTWNILCKVKQLSVLILDILGFVLDFKNRTQNKVAFSNFIIQRINSQQTLFWKVVTVYHEKTIFLYKYLELLWLDLQYNFPRPIHPLQCFFSLLENNGKLIDLALLNFQLPFIWFCKDEDNY